MLMKASRSHRRLQAQRKRKLKRSHCQLRPQVGPREILVAAFGPKAGEQELMASRNLYAGSLNLHDHGNTAC